MRVLFACAARRPPPPSDASLLRFLPCPTAEYFKGVARDDFLASDVEDYFMYMGMLASEVGAGRSARAAGAGG